MGKGELPFPMPPPFPPTWEVRGAYLHWWLCTFMSSVGALKAAGFLRHDLSQIAGALELLGGIAFLPCWRPLSKRLGSEACLRLGTGLILVALGIIVSTYKRRSFVCWSQAVFTLELLRIRGGTLAVILGAGALMVGTMCGLLLQASFGKAKPV
mmetsp:Transcript_79866/g.171161  ORF Transcript_79866/g.171161 Transcript_79866/m.171161 type:complete len:154 (+) Transcript_79866:80-541(+)